MNMNPDANAEWLEGGAAPGEAAALALVAGDSGVLDELRGQADPAFATDLRWELRGRQSRATHNLWWFDIELPIGPIRVVHDEQLIHLISNDARTFEARTEEELGFEPRFGDSERVRTAAREVLAGERRGSEVAFLALLTPFQRKVLRATARIPRGAIRPYNWVAREAGAPGAVRAAGTALRLNPVPFVIPCHRVVKADWSLGRYAAGGTEVKERVLKMEGMTSRRLDWIQHAPHFVGQSESMEFCLPACEGLDETDPGTLRGFERAEDALEAGFTPCGACLPV